ncbi:MAG: tetratricopeptide repeat-containing sensor histidine kinase [Bacteroidetes bacterium]|nr:tetratricopeptide repeat-containing sensor histidine kinase [Bacteroidota bacterium]
MELNLKKDTSRFDILYELAYEYSGEIDSVSLVYSTLAYDLALELNDTARIVKGGRIKAGELRRTEKLDASIQLAKYLLPIAKRNGRMFDLKLLLTSIAVSYTNKAEYDKALKYDFEALVVRENEGDKKGMSIVLNNIGVIYYKLHDVRSALEYYNKALDLKKEMKDKYDLDRLYINMGECYNLLEEHAVAKEFIENGLNSCEGKCSDQIILEGELALGTSLSESGREEESIEHFIASLNVAKKINNYRFQAENLIAIAKVYLKKKNFENVKKYLKETESIARDKGYRFLLETTYKLFSELYEKTADYKNQSVYQSKYIKLKDSILSEKVISNLSQLRTDYQERENIKTIAEKDQVLLLQKEIIKRQQRQYFFIVTIACLIAALAYALFYFHRRQQRAKQKIEEQNILLEVHNRELEENVRERTSDLFHSMEELHRVNDDLDNLIYKTSHDLSGPLASMKGLSNLALMEVKDEHATFYLKKLDEIVNKFHLVLSRLSTVNKITDHQLKPSKVDFDTILDDLISSEKQKGLPQDFEFQRSIDKNLKFESDEFIVYLILENLIDNAIKYYNTTKEVKPYVKVTVSMEGAFGKIEIEDNGIGIGTNEQNHIFLMFNRASERSETGGVGLYLIRQAVEKIGGQIRLIHSSSQGSKFQVLIPDLHPVLQKRNEQEKKLIEFLEQSDHKGIISPII